MRKERKFEEPLEIKFDKELRIEQLNKHGKQQNSTTILMTRQA